jgi:hypothetical protein
LAESGVDEQFDEDAVLRSWWHGSSRFGKARESVDVVKK